MRKRLPLPFFYGWLLGAIGFATMAVGVNARTAFSLLFPPILDDFGWDRGATAGIFSFGFLASALVTPFVGRLMDRRGPVMVATFAGRRRGNGNTMGPSRTRSVPVAMAASVIHGSPACLTGARHRRCAAGDDEFQNCAGS